VWGRRRERMGEAVRWAALKKKATGETEEVDGATV
jgi:hypothetical protein